MVTVDTILDTFNQLTKAVVYISDPRSLESHLIELTKHFLSSNTVLIFHNERHKQRLTASSKFIPDTTSTEKLAIAYDDPLGIDLLVNRKSSCRLNSRQSLLPSIKAELFVPLISPDDVLGCLYIGRSRSEEFKTNDVQLAEYIASTVSIALERQRWIQHLHRLKANNQYWQDKYLAILQAVPNPALFVDMQGNRIDEVNQQFLELTGYTQEQVTKRLFSDLCRLKKNQHGEIAMLKNRQGNTITREIICKQFQDGQHKKKLILFTSETKTKQAHVFEWMQQFAESCNQVLVANDLRSCLFSPMSLIAKFFSLNLVSLHLYDHNNKLRLFTGIHFNDKPKPLSKADAKLLQQGVIKHALELKKMVTIDDVKKEPAFESLLPIAERFHYRAIASIPIQIKDQEIGLLNLFSASHRSWKPLSSLITFCSTVLESVIKYHRQKDELQESNIQHRTLEALNSLSAMPEKIDDLILQCAMEIGSVISFDYFSIALLKENQESVRSFILCHKGIDPFIDHPHDWNAISHSDLGWLNVALLNVGPLKEFEAHQKIPPFSLPTHLSMLLVDGETYLGHISLGRYNKQSFDKDEHQLLKQFAASVAKLLGSHLKITDLQQRVEAHQKVLDLCLMLNPQHNVEEMFEALSQSAPSRLDLSFFSIDKVYKPTLTESVMAFLPQSVRPILSKAKLETFFEELALSNSFVQVTSPHMFAEMFCNVYQEEALEEVKPFIIAPVVQNKKLVAYFAFASKGNNENGIATAMVKPLKFHLKQLLHNSYLYRDLRERREEVDLLISSLSHDFKTPIHNIRGFISTLANKYSQYLPEEPQKYMLRILANIDNMEKLIQDLLELYRLDKYKDAKEIQLDEIIEAALTSIEYAVEEHKIKIISPSQWPTLYARPVAMVQIYTNLLSNAAKFVSTVSSPYIELGYTESHSEYKFFVKDNGPGIKSDLVNKVFDLFFKSSDQSDGGTGIGLTIVKKAVESQGGQVWVDQTEQNGAVIRFTVPKTSD